MGTKLIDEMVTPHFDEADLEYEAVGEDSVAIRIPTDSAGILDLLITDKEAKGVDMLAVTVFHVINFPEDKASDALSIANDMTGRAIGKFFLTEDGGINFGLDWNVTETADREQVRLMVGFAMYTINRFHPIAMTALWGGISVDEAIERLEGEEDEGGDGDGSDILTDAEIRRMLDAD